MKHLKLFESHSEIDSICKKFGIINYTINPDDTVDVDDDVIIINKGLTKLPLKFGKVSGDFDCSRNYLTTLEGAPNEVGSFDCSDNLLKSLEGGPKIVDGGYYCCDNQLTNLIGSPTGEVSNFSCTGNHLISLDGITFGADEFDCEDNPIWEIWSLFDNHKSYKESLDYNYFRGDSIDKRRFKEALDEAGIEMPKRIKGWKWI